MSEPSAPIRYWNRQQVRYRDVDMQQIVYFAKYLEYVDIALDDYLRSLGVVVSETAPSGEYDTAMVHVELDYLAPARYDDVIDVGIRIERLGRSSMDARFEIQRAGLPLVRGGMVLVNFDRDSGRARDLPERLRALIREREDF